MNRKITKKAVCLILSTILFCTFSVNGTAVTNDSGQELSEIILSFTAGSHGCYMYDEETDSMVFVPPEACSGDINGVPQSGTLPNNSPEDSFPLERAANQLTLITGKPTGIRTSTCLIGSRFKDGDDGVLCGTGWLIDDRYIMTAGHLLYRGDCGYAQHIGVYICPSGGRGTAKQFRLGHKYAVGGDYLANPLNFDGTEQPFDTYSNLGYHDDWGIIKLDTPISVDVEYLGRYVVGSASEMSGTYYTQGYPRYYGLNAQVAAWDDQYMYHEYGSIDRDQYLRTLPVVLSSMVAYNGQSGSPLYSYRSSYGYAAEGTLIGGVPGMNHTYFILYNSWLNDYVNKYCT